MIAIVLALNALIGFLTELKAPRSIEALRAFGMRSVRLLRDGHVRIVPAEQLALGDIVVLEPGDSISADLRLVESSNHCRRRVDPVAVEKTLQPVSADARLADRSSMLFEGATLSRSSGIGVVVATGLATELGRVSQLVEEAQPGSSPLEKKLARLTIIFVIGHEHADAPQAVALLRPRHERQRRRIAESSDEFAPSKANAHLALRASQWIKPETVGQQAIGNRREAAEECRKRAYGLRRPPPRLLRAMFGRANLTHLVQVSRLKQSWPPIGGERPSKRRLFGPRLAVVQKDPKASAFAHD
jgi:hypothetical protein